MSGEPGHRILVTGAGGFVGGWLLRELRVRLGEADRIVSTYRDANEAKADPGGIVLDLADRDAIGRTVAQTRPTALIHLAAISAVGAVARDPDAAWDVNVKATHHLATALLQHAPQARFIQIGSGEVYGGSAAAGADLIDEAAPLQPHNLYAVTKAAADLLIGQMAAQGLDAVRFRTFNHTGPGQATDFAVPAFAAQIARIEAGLQEPVIFVGDLAAMRDFCDVRDVVRAYAQAAPGAAPACAGDQPGRRALLFGALGPRSAVGPVRRDNRDPCRSRPAAHARAAAAGCRCVARRQDAGLAARDPSGRDAARCPRSLAGDRRRRTGQGGLTRWGTDRRGRSS